MAKYIAGLIILIATTTSLSAQSDEAKFWRDVINTCAPSSLLADDAVYISASNQIGPGSVWRKGQHDHYLNIVRLSDIATADVAKTIVNVGSTVTCSTGSVTKGWSLKLALPFSFPATNDSVDINFQLSRANSATISISKYSIDTITYGDWEQTFLKLPSSNAFFQEAMDGHGLLAESAISIPSMTITYNYDHALDAGVTAQLSNKHLSLGNGASADVTIGSTGTQIITTIAAPAYVLLEFGKLGKVKIPKSEVASSTQPISKLPYKAREK